MKKLCALLLLVAMILSLAACGGTTSSGKKPGTDPPDSAKEYKEHIKYTFASIQIAEGVDYNAGDDLAKYFTDKFNMEWEILPMGWDNWQEKLNIWINSNDMPDLATWNYNHTDAINYAEQGLIRKLPDDWKQKWPNVAKAYEDTALGPVIEELIGGTYLIPKPIFSANKPTERIMPHMSIAMRKDWAEAVGAEIKDAYKVSELMDIARKIKEQDPGNMGTKLYPMNFRSGYASAVFIGSNTSGEFYLGEDNKYHWMPAEKEALEGLKRWQQAIKEGLLNPEYFTYKAAEDYATFYASGQAAIIYTEGQALHWHTIEKEMKDNLNLEAEKVVHPCSVLGEDGKFHGRELVNFWTAAIFSPKMEDSKFERLMDLFDYVASPEGQLIVRLGFEDKDYTVEADGSYKLLFDSGINDVYPSIHPVYGNMIILTDDFMIINPAFPKKWRDVAYNLYKSKESYADEKSYPPIDPNVYFHSSPAYSKLSYDLTNEYTRLVTMEGDLEAGWKQMIEELMPQIEPVLEELNQKLK